MSEVVVVGSFVAQDGKESEAREAFETLVEPTHAEDGCVLYAAHLESDHVKQALARFDELFAGGDTVVNDALPGGEEKKGSLAAHAAG